MFALATEAGNWYLLDRKAQNAADMAAAGAVIVLAFEGRTAAEAAAIDTAQRNGFTADARTTVTPSIPPSSGPNAGNTGAVEVVVRQQPNLGFARLLLRNPPVITARAVSVLQGTSPVCVLALTGSVSTGGSSATTGAGGCVLASNQRSSQAISVGGGSLTAHSLVTVGKCSGCGDATLAHPYREHQPPVSNPFAHLDSKVLPAQPGAGNCASPPKKGGTMTPGHYCAELKATGQDVYDLQPGTYYFWDASLSVQSGTLRCSLCTNGRGVTIILTGNTPGELDFSGNGSIRLQAPANPADPDYQGVLFYQRATLNTSMKLNGGNNSFLAGAMYFPRAEVTLIGNASVNVSHLSTCTALVARALTVSGSAAALFDVSGCNQFGTTVPQARIVQFLE